MNSRRLLDLLVVVATFTILLPPCAWGAYPAEVPRTGQTACYDDNGTVIDCAGTGQDGELQAGVPWPEPRFVDNFDGTVTDSLTGLEWTKDSNPSGFLMTWRQAFLYIQRLNRRNYLGHNDWRLPNINELVSLVDADQHNPALLQAHPFICKPQSVLFRPITAPAYYPHWSSTTGVSYVDYAWQVDMSNGAVDVFYKMWSWYGISWHPVWPVRSGQCDKDTAAVCLPRTGQDMCYTYGNGIILTSIGCKGAGQDGALQAGVAWPEPRFIDNDNGTVTDSLTGLEWTKDANTAGDNMTWQQALDYVKTLSTGGHSDWRLPNKNELRSLVDYGRYNPALPQDAPVSNIQLSGYWSSTTRPDSAYSAFVVDMYSGQDIETQHCRKIKSLNGNDYYVWPVRGGQD